LSSSFSSTTTTWGATPEVDAPTFTPLEGVEATVGPIGGKAPERGGCTTADVGACEVRKVAIRRSTSALMADALFDLSAAKMSMIWAADRTELGTGTCGGGADAAAFAAHLSAAS
jgi:hypothetical protein